MIFPLIVFNRFQSAVRLGKKSDEFPVCGASVIHVNIEVVVNKRLIANVVLAAECHQIFIDIS
jgi:hypothetical protein